MRRDLGVALNSFADYEICFGNSFHLKYDTTGNKTPFNIKSTGFQLSGISGDLYLSDYPDLTNNEKGTIFAFRKLSDNEYQIVKRSIGTIDYVKGEIILSLLNIVSTEISNPTNIIEIEAIPESNDVIGLQDLYLQIDMNNTNITMISDTISSGSDTSGYSYSRTSSFSNGSITR